MSNKYANLASGELGLSLKELMIVEQDARDFGFEWPDVAMVIQQAISEAHEVADAVLQGESAERIQEEVGDLLHTAISMCVFLGYDMSEMFTKINKKFTTRMTALKAITLQEHALPDLKGQSTEFMLKIWDKAKIS